MFGRSRLIAAAFTTLVLIGMGLLGGCGENRSRLPTAPEERETLAQSSQRTGYVPFNGPVPLTAQENQDFYDNIEGRDGSEWDTPEEMVETGLAR